MTSNHFSKVSSETIVFSHLRTFMAVLVVLGYFFVLLLFDAVVPLFDR